MKEVGIHAAKEALAELADRAYQERVWRAVRGPEVGSLTEAFAQLYDDSGLGDELDSGGSAFGSEIDLELRNLASALRRLDRGQGPEDLLSDPAMGEVRERASAILYQLVRREAAAARDQAGRPTNT